MSFFLKIFDKYRDSIKLVRSTNIQDLMKKFFIPHYGVNTYIDWNKISYYESMPYDGIEIKTVSTLLCNLLAKSPNSEVWLDTENSLISVFKVKKTFIISHWQAILSYTGYQGFLILEEDGSVSIEFTDDYQAKIIYTYSKFHSISTQE